jgi:hypothetical protein
MQSGRQNTNAEGWRDLESIGFVVKRTQNSRAHTGDNKWLSFLEFEWFCLFRSLNFYFLFKHHIDSEVSRVIRLMLKIDLKLIELNYFLNLSCNFRCSFLKIKNLTKIIREIK